jgi:hypothetical protein
MNDPYTRNLVNRNFYHSKTDITGRLLVVLDGRLENRGLHLIQPISRAFPEGTIIELIGIDDPNAGPGSTVDAIAYIGFVELLNGGVLLVGDEIQWKGTVIGTIAGYDETHMPNHQNTIVRMKERIPGKELGLTAGDTIVMKGI